MPPKNKWRQGKKGWYMKDSQGQSMFLEVHPSITLQELKYIMKQILVCPHCGKQTPRKRNDCTSCGIEITKDDRRKYPIPKFEIHD